VELPTV